MNAEVEISVDFTLISAAVSAAVNVKNVFVFLSTSINPLHRLAMDSLVLVFQELKGRPLTEIHPLNADNLLSMMLTSRQYLLRSIVDVAFSMEPTVVAMMDSAIVLQKNKAHPSPKRVREGPKLNLQALAIAVAVASRLKGNLTESQMIAVAQS